MHERKQAQAKDTVNLELKLLEIQFEFQAALHGKRIRPKLTEDSKEQIDNLTDEQRERADRVMEKLLARRKEEANGKR